MTVSSPLWSKALACVVLTRPSNVGLFFLAILLGAFVAAGTEAFAEPKVWLAALSGTLVGAAANVINDVMDIEIDRINKPKRPLASGRLSPKDAQAEWFALTAAGIALSAFISPLHTSIAIGASAVLYAYSLVLKRVALVGNLVVAGVVSTGLIYAALVVGDLQEVWFPVAFSFLFNLGREILKDLEDTEGDKKGGAETLPLKIGTIGSLWVITLLYVLVVALSILPYLQGLYGKWYLW
ncbi:MAG: geranylgeranylglycerol-phosphate geranylgeranyltransferase, partial [Chloroherpetonaceae bacterium]|nr:geranylgeranylglycerol-phosphate geranylgeranyltransferase [Chloroherpetonaceae bacterium]